jgi:hypothetical protein
VRKALIAFALLGLMASAAFAQGTYRVDYYSNVAGGGAKDAENEIRIVNVGSAGSPLTSPVGDVCASIYVFDDSQEMIACCGCRLSPNQFASASVGPKATGKPGTSVSGVVKIVSTAAPFLTGGSNSCSPADAITGADAEAVRVFATRAQVTGGLLFVTESETLPSPLSAEEAQFLPTACSLVRATGRARHACSCSTPGNG